jgi:hypothetical protein
MPLKLNVGLSRKVADNNYGSRGGSVNVELEVESALVTEPGKLKERIRQIFGLVRESLGEELNGNGSGAHHTGNGTTEQRGNGTPNGNGNGTGQRTSSPRPATQSQVKALHAIARNKRADLAQLLQRYRVGRPEDLNIKEASQLIDEMKQGG